MTTTVSLVKDPAKVFITRLKKRVKDLTPLGQVTFNLDMHCNHLNCELHGKPLLRIYADD